MRVQLHIAPDLFPREMKWELGSNSAEIKKYTFSNNEKITILMETNILIEVKQHISIITSLKNGK